MPRVKNVSQKVQMVADRYLQPGESRNVTSKQAAMFRGDVDFEITGLDTPGSLDTAVSTQPTRPADVTLLKVQIVDEETVQTKPEVASVSDASTSPVSTPAPLPKGDAISAKTKKPRGKKKS